MLGDLETLAGEFWDAVGDGNVEFVKQVIGHRPAFFYEIGVSPNRYLKEAARNDDVAMLNALAAAGADISAPEDSYAPEGPIYTAAGIGAECAVRWFAERGAVINHVVNSVNRCLALS